MLRPLPPDAMIIVAGARLRAVSGHRHAGHGRPAALCRGGPAGRARAAANRHPDAARPQADDPAPIDMHRIGTVANIVRYITAPDGTHHLVCQGEQRFQVVEFLDGWPFMVARVMRMTEPETRSSEIEARFLNLRGRPWKPGAPAAGAARADRLPSKRANRPGRWRISSTAYMDVKPEEKQEILETIDITARMDKVSRHSGPSHRGAAAVAEIGRQTKAALDERQRETLLREQMAAIQKRAWRGRRGQGRRNRRARQGDRQGRDADGGRGAGAQGIAPAGAHAGSGGRIRHGPHLSRLADRTAVGAARGKPDRHCRGAPHPRRGSLRPGEDQAPHHRIPRGAQARAARQGADPVLRRAARRRQDLARPIDRARHGPQIRARQPRRRPRRGRDPRPSPHLYRRVAGQYHPGDPQGGRAQLRDDAGRDRQAGRGHPGRSRPPRCSRCSTPSRTAPSATIISACRSI